MFFSEEKLIQKILEYSNKPQFKKLMKERIKEVLREHETWREKTAVSRDEVKQIVRDVLQEIKSEKTLKKDIMESTVESAVEKEVYGTIRIFRMLISGETLYVLTIIAFFVFFVTSFIKHSLVLYILSLVTLLMIILVSYSWRKLHSIIFEKPHKKRS